MASMLLGHNSEGLPQFPESKNPSDASSRESETNSCEFTPDGSQEMEDNLCALCSDVHFQCSVHKECPVLPNDTNFVLAASTVGTIISNKNCPSCRLIAHCINSLPKAQSIPQESRISLFSLTYFVNEQTILKGKQMQKALSKYVEIRRCEHKSEDENTFCLNDSHIMGVLLPVVRHDSSDNTGLTENDAFFNTLEDPGFAHARSMIYAVDVKLLRTWMDFCISFHSSCSIAKTPNDSNTELRLIDVVERRLVDATLVEEYVALSYVWGSGNKKVLQINTLKQLREKGSLSPSAVPRLIADVMDCVAAIGERYLWVDTVCIIQDDELDKQRQLPNMPSIYSHAKLTIIATVEGANDPVIRRHQCFHKVLTPTEFIRGQAYTVGNPPLLAALARTTWYKRGWTFQEALLSRRLLIFTKDLIYWNCREGSWREDQYTEFHNFKRNLTSKISLFTKNDWVVWCHGNLREISDLCAVGLYRQRAQDYSRRLFSNSSDVVWAFLGILEAVKEHFPNGYIWGLPYDQLDAALLWSTCCELTECIEHQYSLSPESRLPIPSWSWIGKGHEIWFPNAICKTKSRVTWHKPVTCWPLDIETIEHDQELVHDRQAVVPSGSRPDTTQSVVFDYAFLHFTAQTAMFFIELSSDSVISENLAAYIKTPQADLKSHPLLLANILLPSKRNIGQISVPVHMFRNDTQQLREFALLSEYPGEIQSEYCEKNTGHIVGHGSRDASHHDCDENDTMSLQQEEDIHRNENNQAQEPANVMETDGTEQHHEGCSHQPALNIMLIEWDKTHKIKNFARRVGIARIDPSAWEEVATTEKTIILG